MGGKKLALLLGIVAVTFILRVPAFYEYLAWDEGNYSFVASSMQKGVVPYKDLPIDKEPGIFFLYGGVFKYLGEDSFMVRLAGAVSVCMASVFVFFIGRMLAGDAAGLIAAFFYGLSMGGLANCGMRTNTEVFMTLFSALAYMSAYAGTKRRSRAWLLAAGLFAGINCSLKLSAVMDLAGICLFALLMYPGAGRGGGRIKKASVWLVPVIAGLVAALLPFIVYLAHKGALDDAWKQVILWRLGNVGRVAADTTPLVARLSAGLRPVVVEEAGMWALACLALAWSLIFRRDRKTLFLVVWLSFSAAAVSMTGRFAAYYFPLIVPPLALFAGYGLTGLSDSLRKYSKPAAAAVLVVVIAGSAFAAVDVNRDYYGNFARAYMDRRAGKTDDYGFHRALQADVVDSYDAADYIRARTAPSDRVYFWLNSGEFYWQVDRTPSTPWLSPLTPGRSDDEARLKAKLMRELLREPPGYIAVRDTVMYFMVPPFRAMDELKKFRELDEFIRTRYELEHVTGRVMIYRYVPEGAVAVSQVFFPEFMEPTVGYLLQQDWFMYGNGDMKATFSTEEEGTPARFELVARGADPAGGTPHMSVFIDGSKEAGFDADPSGFRTYSFSKRLGRGAHTVKIAYDNDGPGRDLLFRRLVITHDRPAGTGCQERLVEAGGQ